MIEPHYPREDFVAQELLWLLLLLPFKGVPWRHLVVEFRHVSRWDLWIWEALGPETGCLRICWISDVFFWRCPAIPFYFWPFCGYVQFMFMWPHEVKYLKKGLRRGTQKQLNQLRRKWPSSPATKIEDWWLDPHWHPGWGTWPWGAILKPTPSWSLVYVRTLSAEGCWSPLEPSGVMDDRMTHIGNPGVTDWTWQGYVIPLMMREVSGVLTIQDVVGAETFSRVWGRISETIWPLSFFRGTVKHTSNYKFKFFWFKILHDFSSSFWWSFWWTMEGSLKHWFRWRNRFG